MIISNVEQGTQEWFEERAGRPSASCFDKLLTIVGDQSKQREKYMYQLAGERVSGLVEASYSNAAMERGKEVEEEARQFYSLTNDVKIERVGICYPDKKKLWSCSPDGLVGDDGLVEIKCPIMTTHVSYLLKKNLLADYFQQVQGQLLVTGRKWCDLISYYPCMKPLIIRVERDEKFLKALKIELEVFVRQLDEIVEKIR